MHSLQEETTRQKNVAVQQAAVAWTETVLAQSDRIKHIENHVAMVLQIRCFHIELTMWINGYRKKKLRWNKALLKFKMT